jgi:DNA-directed RNA polymerase specialized sigma24 family protein
MSEKMTYTPEQTQKVVVDYLQGVPVETIAESLGKSVRSIIAKLSREGVYKKKEYVTKTGESVTSKEELCDKIGTLCGLSEGEIDSLTKANKTALQKILQKVSFVV